MTEMEDGNKRPLWLPEITGVAPSTILGMQYAVDQAIDSMETGKKFIFCGDFDRFIVRRVTYMTLKRLVERYAEYDQTAFSRFTALTAARKTPPRLRRWWPKLQQSNPVLTRYAA